MKRNANNEIQITTTRRSFNQQSTRHELIDQSAKPKPETQWNEGGASARNLSFDSRDQKNWSRRCLIEKIRSRVDHLFSGATHGHESLLWITFLSEIKWKLCVSLRLEIDTFLRWKTVINQPCYCNILSNWTIDQSVRLICLNTITLSIFQSSRFTGKTQQFECISNWLIQDPDRIQLESQRSCGWWPLFWFATVCDATASSLCEAQPVRMQ